MLAGWKCSSSASDVDVILWPAVEVLFQCSVTSAITRKHLQDGTSFGSPSEGCLKPLSPFPSRTQCKTKKWWVGSWRKALKQVWLDLEKNTPNPHNTICTLLPPSELKENKISLWTKMNQIWGCEPSSLRSLGLLPLTLLRTILNGIGHTKHQAFELQGQLQKVPRSVTYICDVDNCHNLSRITLNLKNH